MTFFPSSFAFFNSAENKHTVWFYRNIFSPDSRLFNSAVNKSFFLNNGSIITGSFLISPAIAMEGAVDGKRMGTRVVRFEETGPVIEL